MKKLILLFSILFVQISFGQETAEPEKPLTEDLMVYNATSVESTPEYPGGVEAFSKFVAKNYRIPTDKNFKGGKVILSFVVEKDGYPTEFKIIKDPGFGSAEEAIRVIKKAKRWTPAQQNGKNVRCYYTLPIQLPSN